MTNAGQTKSINGHTYRLNDHARWERQDHDEPHPDELHAHAESSVGKVTDKHVAGLLSDLRAKDNGKGLFKSTGKTSTQHNVAMHKIAQIANGDQSKADGPMVDLGNGKKTRAFKAFGGLVVNFGDGRVGFSSEAGAIVLGPREKDKNGIATRSITYTHKTATVKKAIAKSKGDTAIGRQVSETAITPKPAVQQSPIAAQSPIVQAEVAHAVEKLNEPSLEVKEAIHKAAVELHEKAAPIAPKIMDAVKEAAHTLAQVELKKTVKKKRQREAKHATWRDIVKENSKAWKMKPKDYEERVNELHAKHVQEAGLYEAAKERARQLTGATAAHINRWENQGHDHGSNRDDIAAAKFDEHGRTIANDYAGVLGWGAGEGDTDYGEHIWNLIREGKGQGRGKYLSKKSPEFLGHVDEHLRTQGAGGDEWSDEDAKAHRKAMEEMTPFKKKKREVICD